MLPSKQERFEEFLRRFEQSPNASSHDEALRLLSETLNAVEDEMTDIPYQPDRWQTDGRMYPPQEDNARRLEERGDVTRYRSRGHNTYIRENGAIEIQDINGATLFEKPGADGRGVELHKSEREGE
jgi:hypothetical protein